MVYARRNTVEEQQEACQKAHQLAARYGELQIMLDPIDWHQFGLWAPVNVGTIEIASLRDLWQRDRDDLLRQVQIKLLEHAAREALRFRPGLKAVMWSPVEVIRPQAFLSLWVITFETHERIPIIEFLNNGQRSYTPFSWDGACEEHLAMLFGPAHEGEYQPGTVISIKEREHHYTGEVLYILSPGKVLPGRKQASRRSQTISEIADASKGASRYLVDCHDGFPHIVYQSQIVE
jgi:hypothetical protein